MYLSVLSCQSTGSRFGLARFSTHKFCITFLAPPNSIGDCLSYSFCLILMKLGACDLCANMQKAVEQIKNFDYKLFGEFLKFYVCA